MFNCRFCSKEFKNSGSVKNHECRCPCNTDRILQQPTYNAEYREKQRKMTLKKFEDPEYRRAHSARMKKVVSDNPDSYNANNVCGRSKPIEYNGIMFHSKWEVMVVEFLDKENIQWSRYVAPLPYFWNGGWHLYFPDFYLPELDYYIEVKGYERERVGVSGQR